MLNYDNTELSFSVAPPEEQVKLLLAQNRVLASQIKQQNEQFASYEASDKKLLSQVAHLNVENEILKKKLGLAESKDGKLLVDTRLCVANNELERLRQLIDAMGGDPGVPTNRKWYAKVVRAYLTHYGIKTDELSRFVRFMSKARNNDPEAFFSIPISQQKPY